MPNLENSISEIYPLSSASLATLCKSFKALTYPKKAFLSQVGFPNPWLVFVQKGLFREFYVNDAEDESGSETEITSMFTGEGQFAFGTISFISGSASRRYYQAMEESTVFVISHDELKNLCKNFPEILEWKTALYEQKMIHYEKRLRIIRTQSSLEGYQLFRKRFAEIADRIPDKYIASYLNITPSSLSRIRKKVAKRQL